MIVLKKLGLTHKDILLYIFIFVVIVAGDQLTKIIVDSTMKLNQGYQIIENFFYFTYSYNYGAAWGMMQGKLTFFYGISILATIGIVYSFIESKPYQYLTRFGLVVFFSGMIGNLIDRLTLGYVRDFIDFIIFGYDFPIFNIADIAVCMGVGLILLDVIIEEYKTWKISKSL